MILFVSAALAAYTIIGVGGQSLSFYSTGGRITTTQPYANKMCSSLSYDAATFTWAAEDSAWPLTDLIEPAGPDFESPRSSLGNWYRGATGTDVVVVAHSKGGAAYSSLKRGTDTWNLWAKQIEALGSREPSTYLAHTFVHGEADHCNGTSRSAYADDLHELQQDITTKANASTSNSPSQVPLYVWMFGSWTASGLCPSTTSVITGAYDDAVRAHPQEVVIVGPEYPFTYAVDGFHLISAEGYRMGSMSAEAIAYGPSWKPLSPVTATRNGATVIVTLYVPWSPVVIDTDLVTDPGSYGWEYTDDSSPPSISSVALCTGTNAPAIGCVAQSSHAASVAITLASVPTGGSKSIRYAWTGVLGHSGGPTTGPRGNFRDSNPATDARGSRMEHWLIPFERAL